MATIVANKESNIDTMKSNSKELNNAQFWYNVQPLTQPSQHTAVKTHTYYGKINGSNELT